MGYVVEISPCVVQKDSLCTFRLVNGSILAGMSLIGLLLSSLEIFFLRFRIRLSACQNLFLMNVAVSDNLISLIGVFRGLGIISSKFVGAPNDTATTSCIIYIICLNSFIHSGILVLLPLNIDRLLATLLPMRHKSVITTKTSLAMILMSWLPILILLVYDFISFWTNNTTIEYYENFHRCEIEGRNTFVEQIILLIVPFILVVLMSCAIIKTIVGTKRKCSRFLYISTGIIITNLLTHTPSIIVNIKSISMSYEASQILITTFYNSGIINPLIYFLAHPTARKYVREISLSSKDPFSTTDMSEAATTRTHPQLVRQRRISKDFLKTWNFDAARQREMERFAKATSFENGDQGEGHPSGALRKLTPRSSLPERSLTLRPRVPSLRFSNEERVPRVVTPQRSFILPHRERSTFYREL